MITIVTTYLFEHNKLFFTIITEIGGLLLRRSTYVLMSTYHGRFDSQRAVCATHGCSKCCGQPLIDPANCTGSLDGEKKY